MNLLFSFILFYSGLINLSPYTITAFLQTNNNLRKNSFKFALKEKMFPEKSSPKSGLKKVEASNNSFNYTTFVFKKEIPTEIYGYDCRYTECEFSDENYNNYVNLKKMEILNKLQSADISENKKLKCIETNYYEIYKKTNIKSIDKDKLYKGFEEFEEFEEFEDLL